jgi:glycosyltransferase involved in cell wall biosynthesis
LSVSVLIPAFRPTFLGQAIASVLAQGHEDFELIVSDDSGADEVVAVVERFRDPRIQYVATKGRTGALNNMGGLWKLAKHDLVKFLFDDDLMMPHALGELLDEVAKTPNVSFVFGRREEIDERGRVTGCSPEYRQARALVDQREMAGAFLTKIVNPIGEFSNILINRGVGVAESDYLYYEGFELRVVTDVAFFLNAARRAPAAGLNRIHGAFRTHANQNSSPAFNPLFAVGICEWELFIRGEFGRGNLSKPQALSGLDRLVDGYESRVPAFPPIRQMAGGLVELRRRIEDGETDLLDTAFRTQWATFVDAVLDTDKRSKGSPSTAPQNA